MESILLPWGHRRRSHPAQMDAFGRLGDAFGRRGDPNVPPSSRVVSEPVARPSLTRGRSGKTRTVRPS